MDDVRPSVSHESILVLQVRSDDVLLKPSLSEPKMVTWSTKEVKTTSRIQGFESKAILIEQKYVSLMYMCVSIAKCAQKYVSLMYMCVSIAKCASIPANSPYFGGRLLILTSNLCKIHKHNFIIYNFKNLIIAPNRVG